ncbi:TetR family transcriptional regulator [Caballeronia sp. SEWSISQ10-4 2]|nr:TetR family transcriptional regulator [Caballeronia sp. SEWSISQ10-4 2]
MRSTGRKVGKQVEIASDTEIKKIGLREKAGSVAARASSNPMPRNGPATAERILRAAIDEFAEHGYMGARVDAIAKRANANMRMLYHYFGNKNELYVKVLESVFGDIREQESKLNLKDVAPLDAMIRLFDFTYSHFAANPLFIRILTGENFAEARHLHESQMVPALTSPLLGTIKDVLKRGETQGIFRKGIDALQLYVSMVSLSYFHISNAPTLSWIFSVDLRSPKWRAARQDHARSMLLSYLLSNSNVSPKGSRKTAPTSVVKTRLPSKS